MTAALFLALAVFGAFTLLTGQWLLFGVVVGVALLFALIAVCSLAIGG